MAALRRRISAVEVRISEAVCHWSLTATQLEPIQKMPTVPTACLRTSLRMRMRLGWPSQLNARRSAARRY